MMAQLWFFKFWVLNEKFSKIIGDANGTDTRVWYVDDISFEFIWSMKVANDWHTLLGFLITGK